MKVTLKKVLLLTLFVLVFTALLVVSANAATLDDEENASITDDATAVTAGAVARIGDAGGAYYTTVPLAVAAVQSGDTITMIDDIGSEAEPLQLTKNWIDIPTTNITLDGNGHTIIAETTVSGYDNAMIKARDAAGGFCLKNLTIDLTHPDAASNESPILNIGVVEIKIEGCNLYTNKLGIFARQQRANVTITDTNIYAGYNAYESYDSKDRAFTLTFKNCVLQSETAPAIQARIDNYLVLENTTVRGGNGTDITLTQSSSQSTAVTIKGNTTFTPGNLAIQCTEGTDTVTFDASYQFPPVYRKSGGNHYFYDNLADALAAVITNDVVTLYGNATLDSVVTLPGSVTVDGQDKYTVTSTANVAFLLNGDITATFNNMNLHAEKTAFAFDGSSASAAVVLNSVGFKATTAYVNKLESNTFTNNSTIVAKIGDVEYPTLSMAMFNAVGDDTVMLVADIGTTDAPLTLSGTWFQLTSAATNVTLDGNNKTIIVTSTGGHLMVARDRAGFTMKNLTVRCTFADDVGAGTAILNTGGKIVITIENCKLTSNKTALSCTNQRQNVTVTGSEITAGHNVYVSTDNNKANSNTVITTFTNCTFISSGAIAIASNIDDRLILDGTTIEGVGTDIDCSGGYATIVEIKGATAFKSGNLTLKAPDEVVFTDYTGTAIFRQNGTNYHSYALADIANAFVDPAEGDVVYTYSSETAAAIGATNYAVTEADGKYIIQQSKASIGTTNYTSLEAALAAASNGDTIKLLADNTLSASINKAITINGQGFKLDITADVAFAVPANGTLTLENVALTASATAFTVGEGSKIVLKGTTVTAATMLGAGFNDQATNPNSFSTDNVNVATAIAAVDGYYINENEGTYTVTTVKPTNLYAASVTVEDVTTNYDVFADALSAAIAAAKEGKTVTLLLISDAELGTTGIVIDAPMTVVGDITAPQFIYTGTGAAITVSAAGVAVNNLTVTAANGTAFSMTDGATLALSNLTVSGKVLGGVVNGNVTVDEALAETLAGEGYIVTTDRVVRMPVAIIGEVKYASLVEAIAAAAAGDTVTLLANVTLTEAIILDKSITFVPGSYTVTAQGKIFTLSGASAALTVSTSALSVEKLSGALIKNEKEGNVTYYNDLAAAVSAAAAGDTVKLIDNITVSFGAAHYTSIGVQNLTLDGCGYKATVTSTATHYSSHSFIAARDSSNGFVLQNLTIDYTTTAPNASFETPAINIGGNVTVTIKNCNITSNRCGIFAHYFKEKLIVEDTVINAVGSCYNSGNNGDAQTLIFTRCQLTTTGETYGLFYLRKNAALTLQSTTVNGNATFAKDLSITNTVDITIGGNTSFTGTHLSIKNANSLTFDNYTGTQIIRQNGKDYSFLNEITDAMADIGENEVVYTYSKATADAIAAKGYSVTEADGIYTVDGLLDFTAINGAIDAANTAKQSATVTNKPCDVGAGNYYVSAADVEALEAAIAAAQAKKEAAINNAALTAATAELNEAVAAFNAKRIEGKPHEKADTAPACSTTCQYCNVVGTVTATANHTTAVPCTDTVCTVCGETASTIAHERKFDCSNLCKYCNREHFADAIEHERVAVCSKICKFCETEQFYDAQAHEQKAPCSNICKFCETEQFNGTGGHERKFACSNLCVYCETEQFENAVPCEGTVICTDTICKYCGGEVTPAAHDGEFACSTTCKYCELENVVTDAVACEGERACDAVCKYCSGEAAHEEHTGEFACSASCQWCGTQITDPAICVGEIPCTSTTCKYGCGAAVTPIPHSGEHDCSTTCQYCDVALENTPAHSFNYACDTNCKVCGEAISHKAHEGKIPCAASCKYCGKGIVPGNHEGEYKCSTVCGWCGVEIEPAKDHVRKNSCDPVCQVCLEELEQVHVYDNDCDKNCNGCNLARETQHKYDNDCDTECNVCGLVREVTHSYKNKRDHTCELCGFDKAPTEEGEDASEGLDTWVIVVIAVGAVVVIAGAVVTVVVLKKKKANKPGTDPEGNEAAEEATEEATEEGSDEQTEEVTEEESKEQTEEE